MTIPEACQLILQAGAMGEGGEIFILDMGSAVKIDDMARDLINLSGFEPEADIAIEYIGLRAGEKLHEELHAPDENVISTTHPKIMMIRNTACDLVNLEKAIEELVAVCDHKNSASIRRKLQAIIETYEPAGAIPASGHGGP